MFPDIVLEKLTKIEFFTDSELLINMSDRRQKLTIYCIVMG